MSADELIMRELDEGILRLTLNDHKRRNALSEAMLEGLKTIFKDANDDPRVRVIILSANGPAFSAGHDLKELNAARQNSDKGEAYFAKIMNLCRDVMLSIVKCSKPVIAEIDGVATAAGCQLVASCDLAFASHNSQFGTPGVNIGLFCSTPMVALSRNVQNKHALEMLLTGDMISAQRAAEIGLINHAVSQEELTRKTNALAQKIASKSRQTLAIGKSAFYAQKDMTLENAYEYAVEVMTQNMLAQDAIEGISAFIEKRHAKWKDHD